MTKDQVADILSGIRDVRRTLYKMYKLAPDAQIEEADRIAANIEIDLLFYLEQLEGVGEISEVEVTE